ASGLIPRRRAGSASRQRRDPTRGKNAIISASSWRERAAPAHPSAAIEHGHSPHKAPIAHMAQIRGDIAYRTNLYLNRAPSASMSPVVGGGKWIGKTYLPVPAISVRNFRRDRAACAGSQSKIVDQSGSRHCKVWCMRSPITTACCPRERILTQQWWGEWPGVGTSQNVSSS